MDLQKEILSKYRELRPGKSYQLMSKELGINSSRLYRLFNGASMKLKEYQKFKQGLNQKAVEMTDIWDIKHEFQFLKETQVREIKQAIEDFKQSNFINNLLG